MPSYRKKPLAQLEHGTRIYAPSPTEARYRVVATDPVSGERIFVKCRTEDAARTKAREWSSSSPNPHPSATPTTLVRGRCRGCRGCRCSA